jgi:hypothetical protein
MDEPEKKCLCGDSEFTSFTFAIVDMTPAEHLRAMLGCSLDPVEFDASRLSWPPLDTPPSMAEIAGE